MNEKIKLTFKSSIKTKLIVIAIVLLLVPMVVVGVISYLKSSDSLDQLGAVNLKNSVELTLEMMDAYQSEVENGTITLEDAQENVKQIILGERGSDGTRPINENIDVGENGYLFIADSEGNLVAHPTIEGENTWNNTDSNGKHYAQEYIQTGLSGGGYSTYMYPLPNDQSQIEEKITYSKAYDDWNWVVVASTYMLDFNKPAAEILRTVVMVTLITLIVGTITIWFFTNSITTPVKLVSDQIKRLANRDLTVEPLTLKSKDEIGELGTSVNHLQTELTDILTNVSNTSKTLYSQSEELTQSTNEVKLGAEQISTTMEEIAQGSESQATNVSDLASAINSFAYKIQAVNENAEEMDESSQGVLQMTDEGRQLMEKSTKQMKNIDWIVQEAVEKVQKLDNQSKEISQLVTVIRDVADQTNLLALNAAIEAARAGEHGKGFAIVATEVRKLAEQVANSVTDITEIVDAIQQENASVVDSLMNSYQQVEEGTSQIEATGQTFHQISGAINEMAENISVIRQNLGEITANSQEVNSSIEEIASLSEQSAAGVEETAATVQQSSSATEEVAGSSERLSKLAEELNSMVNRFKL